MINGNSLVIQIGKESSYGTLATPSRQIKVASESLKPEYNKVEEGLLTGGKAAGRKEIMSIKTSGSISTLARPDDIGLFLGAALGVEDTVVSATTDAEDAYKHVFTAIDTDEDSHLPSLSIVADRKVDVFTYNGLKIDSLSLSAEPESYLKLDANFVGKDEGTSGTLQSLSPSPLKAFKFRQGTVSVDDTPIADITSIKLDYSNSLDSSIQTTSTGLYFKEPEVGVRSIQTSVEMLYTTGTEALRNSLYKTDADAAIELLFTSDEEVEEDIPYSLKITIPCNQCSSADANVGGADILKQSMTFDALEDGTHQLITVELINGNSAKYI